jgi:hypothetical protein
MSYQKSLGLGSGYVGVVFVIETSEVVRNQTAKVFRTDRIYIKYENWRFLMLYSISSTNWMPLTRPPSTVLFYIRRISSHRSRLPTIIRRLKTVSAIFPMRLQIISTDQHIYTGINYGKNISTIRFRGIDGAIRALQYGLTSQAATLFIGQNL